MSGWRLGGGAWLAGPLVLVLLVLGIEGGILGWRTRPERHLARAEHLLERGDPGAVSAWLELPESVPATRDRALLLRARAALALGHPAGAVAPLEQVDPEGPWAADAAFWKGRTLFEGRQFIKAIAWFQHALELRPDDAETLRWIAATAYDLGARHTAINALEEVVRLQSDDARAWRTMALIYKENQDLDRARPAYETALRIDPDQPEARFELAETLVGLGRFAEAEQQIAACRGGPPLAERGYLLAQCLRHRGDFEKLRDLLEILLDQVPDHAGLFAQCGLLAQSEGRGDEAVAWFDRAVALEPHNARLRYQRGQALRQVGRVAEARRDLERAQQLNEALDRLSELDEQAAQNPEDPEVRYQLGRLCLSLGKTEMAVSWFYAALACDPEHEGARSGLRDLAAR